MEKNQQIPIPKNESERLQALEAYDIMDTAAEEQFDRLTLLASEICETPISLVSLLDKDRQWFKSSVGLGASETPREISFCQHAIMDNKIFEVQNANEDARFQSNVLVTGDPNISFYAGHPLIDENGFPLGTLCVIDKEPKVLTDFQKRALKILATEVVEAIKTRKESKELREYKKFFDLSLDFLCIAGTDGFFKKINPTFAEKLGFNREELIAKPFVDFVHPDDVEATIAETKKLAEGHKTIGFVNRYRKKSGDYMFLHWTASPDSKTGELFAAAHDLTDFQTVNDKLIKTNEQLDQFAYVVSHDLKAPLRAISTLSDFLVQDLEGKLDEDSEENLKLIKSRVARMDGLIQGVLEYSRIGREEQVKEEINVNGLVTELIDSLAPPENFKIEIKNTLPTLEYQRLQLNQVFQNFISNAIKYHDKSNGTVEISSKENDQEYIFSVKDDGPGIDSKYHDKVFGVFQTLQSRDEIESTGIGLSIVKKIIEENHGRVWIESEVGHGATFLFTISKSKA